MMFNEAVMITEFARIYLAIFFSVVALFYSVRIITRQRSLGKPLVFPGPQYCVSWWNHMCFRFFRISIFCVCCFRLAFPAIDDYLIPFYLFEQPILIALGLILLSLGFISTLLIHFKLGAHWRSGIDPSAPGELLRDGVYQFSRHPMFLSIAIAQLGFFLALPSLFSWVCLLLGIICLYTQALAEERHLKAIFNPQYLTYAKRVRRWV